MDGATGDRQLSPEIAQALGSSVWLPTEKSPEGAGFAGLYRRGIYGPIAQRRRESTRSWRSPEPWTTLQSVLELPRARRWRHNELRWEGYFGQHDYSEAVRSIALCDFDAPFLYVAGYPRSGTTSLQNVVAEYFRRHIPIGRRGQAPHALDLWWQAKHNAQTAADLARIDPSKVLVLLAVRPCVDALTSWSVYSEHSDQAQIDSRVADWRRMIQVAVEPGTRVFPFEFLSSSSPETVAECISTEASIPEDQDPGHHVGWDDLHRNGMQATDSEDVRRSNLPDVRRSHLLAQAREAVLTALGDARCGELEEEYQQIVGKAFLVANAPNEVPAAAHYAKEALPAMRMR